MQNNQEKTSGDVLVRKKFISNPLYALVTPFNPL